MLKEGFRDQRTFEQNWQNLREQTFKQCVQSVVSSQFYASDWFVNVLHLVSVIETDIVWTDQLPINLRTAHN